MASGGWACLLLTLTRCCSTHLAISMRTLSCLHLYRPSAKAFGQPVRMWFSVQETAPHQIKSNQIKSLLLSHHHSTSALVSEILMSVLQTVQKNNRQFTYGQTVQKNNNNLPMDRQCKKTTNNLPMDRQCKKTTNNLPMDRQCKKTTNNLPMDRQCKKTALEHLQCSRQCKKNNNNLHMDRQCKKTTTAIYIWTDSAKNNSNLHMDSTYLQTVQKTMCKIHIHILSTLSVL